MLNSVNECVLGRQVMNEYRERIQILCEKKKMKRRGKESSEMERSGCNALSLSCMLDKTGTTAFLTSNES